MTDSLLDRTKTLLAARGTKTLEEIAEESGVGEHWLRKFACGSILNPTVNNLQMLHDYLVKHGSKAA